MSIWIRILVLIWIGIKKKVESTKLILRIFNWPSYKLEKTLCFGFFNNKTAHIQKVFYWLYNTGLLQEISFLVRPSLLQFYAPSSRETISLRQPFPGRWVTWWNGWRASAAPPSRGWTYPWVFSGGYSLFPLCSGSELFIFKIWKPTPYKRQIRAKAF